MPTKYNEYVKSPDMEIEYTEEMIDEIMKCKNDHEYFIKNYVKISTTDDGERFFDTPYPYQIELWNKFRYNRKNIALCSRQSGKTECVGAFTLWYCCFHSHKRIGIGSNKERSAKLFLGRIKFMYERLPLFLKPGVRNWAEKSVVFDNNTRLDIAATSKDAFRGDPLSMLILDELAFVDPPWKAEEFWASNYPTISASKTSKIIIISTPNGLHNLYHRLYTAAKNKKNTFIESTYDWMAVPSRDEEWKKEVLSDMTEIKWNQEFGCVGEKTLVCINSNVGNIQIGDLYEKLKTEREYI